MSETPILDLDQPPPASPKRWSGILLGVAIGIFISAIHILADRGLMFDWNWPALNGLLLLPALLIATAVHEVAHLIAGRFVGIDTGGISIGPLLVLRSGTRWVVQFKWRSVFGGFFKPLSTNGNLTFSNYGWMIAAGPLASFLLAAALSLFLHRYGSGPWNFTGTVFWTTLFLGVVSVIPFSQEFKKSDGAKLWQLLRHPE